METDRGSARLAARPDGAHLDVPDHTTLSRRTAGLDMRLQRYFNEGRLHLVVDATGVGVFGEGEWAAAKWGGRGKRGWRKLHVAVDEDGFIVAAELTDKAVADATALPELLDQVMEPIERVTADGAYDRRAAYQALHDLGACSVIPPGTHGQDLWRSGAVGARCAPGAHRAGGSTTMARSGRSSPTGARREHLRPVQIGIRWTDQVAEPSRTAQRGAHGLRHPQPNGRTRPARSSSGRRLTPPRLPPFGRPSIRAPPPCRIRSERVEAADEVRPLVGRTTARHLTMNLDRGPQCGSTRVQRLIFSFDGHLMVGFEPQAHDRPVSGAARSSEGPRSLRPRRTEPADFVRAGPG